MAAHRYWRIYCANVQGGGGQAGFSEIELRQSKSGSDETGSGTASASSQWDGNHAPAYGVDNDINTKWGSAQVVPQWWAYDFGDGITKDIIEVSMTSRNDGYWNAAPNKFYLEYSDNGTDWTRVYYWNPTWTAQAQTLVFNDENLGSSFQKVSVVTGQVEYTRSDAKQKISVITGQVEYTRSDSRQKVSWVVGQVEYVPLTYGPNLDWDIEDVL